MQKEIMRRHCGSMDGLNELHPLLQRIYAARQVKTSRELARSFDHLLSYQKLLGIEQAIAVLLEAISKKSHILIVGDFDADGATSTALAVRALRQFGAGKVGYLVPNRFSYGYGLTPELVSEAVKRSPDLIITVDNGIANHSGVAAAKSKGIKVIITDHHLPAETLPDADAIVNPNQYEDLFPSKNLAGVGVIFYVMLALRKRLKEEGWFTENNLPEPNMSRFLDLVALGTVADLVALDQNNRIMIHHGLQRIRAGLCAPGIIALLEIAGREFMQVQAADLGFAVAARLNAAGRLDDMSLGIECLLTDDSNEARTMAAVLNKLNLERRGIESEMQAQALLALNKFTESNFKNNLPKGLCLYDESWHQGVIGILAARIKDKFHRPVIIFAPGQEGELKGSARSINGLHIRDLLALMSAKHPDLIRKFGGHAMAAGLTIAKHLLNDFSTLFNQFVSKEITEDQLMHSLYSDGELTNEDLNLEIAALLRDAGPWGQAFPEPLFDNVFTILEQRIVGDKHLKLRLGKNDKILDGMAFFIDSSIWPNHRCQMVRAVYRLDINKFKGRRSLQLIIDHLQPV